MAKKEQIILQEEELMKPENEKWNVTLSFDSKSSAEKFIQKSLLRKGFKERFGNLTYSTNYNHYDKDLAVSFV